MVVKATVDAVYIRSICPECKAAHLSSGDGVVRCPCGVSFTVEANVRITTQLLEKGKNDAITEG